MKKTLLYATLLILVVAITIALSKYHGYQDFKTEKIDLKGETTIEIEKGSSWKKVASTLKNKELITDEKMFYWLIKENKWDGFLKTGEFDFKGKMSPVDVAQRIMSGKVKMYSFTIPEGYNKFDAASVFKEIEWVEGGEKFLEICHDKNFLSSIGAKGKASCEGLLFPSTYSFPKGVDIIAVMTKMAEQLKAVLKKYEKEMSSLDFDSYDFLKLASIIEKETGVKEEQPLIASVFLNRRRIGMKMQTDPSVIYGLLPKFNGNLTKKDLMTDHPWNTYTRYGFPATPLCFPGEGAIKSIVYPDSTKYLYFVATGKGYHYFSKTLVEHNAAVDHYQIKKLRTKFQY
ncbi:MAG: endolytic transglycosylase MltG [bacterium]